MNSTAAPVRRAIRTLLQASEDVGEVRPGLDPADVLLLMGFLRDVAPGNAGEEQAGRVLELAIRGLK